MKKLIIILTCVLLGCDELVRTQNEAPEIKLDKSEILADGTSEILIKAIADHELSSTQAIRFTTTEGYLIALPPSTSSALVKDLTLTPRDQEASVILRSSLEENENVIVSVTVNNLGSMKTIKFKRSCPDEVKISLDKSQVSQADSIRVFFTFLRDDAHNISLNTRIDCSIDPDSVASITPTIYSDSFGKASAIIKPISAGSAYIKLTSKSGCSLTIPPTTFKIN